MKRKKFLKKVYFRILSRSIYGLWYESISNNVLSPGTGKVISSWYRASTNNFPSSSVCHLNVALCFFNDFCIISKERRRKNFHCQRMPKVPFSPFHSVQQVMLRILWFSFKKLCIWNRHLWPVQSPRRKVWFAALLWEQNLRKGMTWWDTYERLHLLVLLVSLRKIGYFFPAKGDEVLRYKHVLILASCLYCMKIMSTCSWFFLCCWIPCWYPFDPL